MITQYPNEAFLIDGFLSQEECTVLVGIAEDKGFREAKIISGGQEISAPEIRNNDRVIIDSTDIVESWYQKTKDSLPPEIDGLKVYGLNERLRFYRYAKNQQFRRHKDFPYKDSSRVSKLSFIVYLNDNFTGGETEFNEFTVSPKEGAVLVFNHELLHEGKAVTGGVKYAVRTDVMYKSA